MRALLSLCEGRVYNLPPWQANEYFHLPTEKIVTLNAATVGQLCDANPMRVGVLLGDPQAGQTRWSWGVSKTIGSQEGFGYGTNAQPVMLTHSQWGPLVQMELFGFAPVGNVFVTVLELVLSHWPMHDPDDTADVRDHIANLEQVIKSLSAKINAGGRVNAVYSDPDGIFRRGGGAVTGVRGP